MVIKRVAERFSFILLSILLVTCQSESGFNPDEPLNNMQQRILGALKESKELKNPRSMENGQARFVSPTSWTSGFFPGILWQLHRYSQNDSLLSYAQGYTAKLEPVKKVRDNHDLGFMLYNSFGIGFDITQNDEYKKILLEGAQSLASRYNDSIGSIKSWDRPGKWQFPVIIDNMMNLEYLFWATKATGDSAYYDMAYQHALTTYEHHFREDYSTYHVVDYDTVTYEPIWKGTHQGYSDESDWARGQAWGLYGFTMAYRETRDTRFLERAKQIETFLFGHSNMPDDLVPYWDLSVPNVPDAPRDASAAAVIASALIELSEYVETDTTQKYLANAKTILINLEKSYRFRSEDKSNYFYLNNSVGNMNKDSEVDVPIIYADYYFVEALLRLKKKI